MSEKQVCFIIFMTRFYGFYYKTLLKLRQIFI